MSPTYRRHPMDKRRPAPHLAPRSPKRRRREQHADHVIALFMQALQSMVGAAHVCQDDFALAPPPDPIYSRAAAAALGPDPRQENHS
ncbi:MAG: hypothetical protein LBE67_12260 [Kocuria palustris]|uniref:hypothetical protein n=1 Tax=Kocuria palustris TaxID=71999 RepID=UPI001DFF7D03|nr:hypothetical protein [Kocuria palustris]MBZ6375739.1 hypothetical protein [Kocuria palustris]